MANPSLTTPTTGAKITAGGFGVQVKAYLDGLSNMDRVSVYQGTGSSCATGVSTLITFDTEEYDSNGMHNPAGNAGRLVAINAGTYTYNASISWPSNATSWRYLMIRKNAAGSPVGGTRVWQGFIAASAAVSNNTQSITRDIVLAAGDYLEMYGIQNSGGSLTTVTGVDATFFQLRQVSF